MREETLLAQTPSHHFRKTREGGLEFLRVRSIAAERVLVADGFGGPLFTNLAGKPRSGVLTAGFADERRSPFAEALLKGRFTHTLQVGNPLDAHLVQPRFGHPAYTRNLSY